MTKEHHPGSITILPQRGQEAYASLHLWMAAVTWAGGAILALVMLFQINSIDWPTLIFFSLLYLIARILLIRLPGGWYTGLITSAVAAAALVMGYQVAVIIPAVMTIILIPGVLVASLFIPTLRSKKQRTIFDLMGDSGALALSIFPAGWLLEHFNPAYSVTSFYPNDIWPALGMCIFFFAIHSLFAITHLRLQKFSVIRYIGQYWWPIITGGLLGALVLAPIIAAYTSFSFTIRLVVIGLFTLATVIFYFITQTKVILNDRLADLHTINRIGQALNNSAELDDLLGTLFREISQLLDTSGFYLALYDEPTQTLIFKLHYVEGQPVPYYTRPFLNGLTEHIIRTHKPLLLTHDVQQKAAALGLKPFGSRARTYLGTPIIAGGRVLGVMGLRNYAHEYAYDENDQKLLETVATAAAVALQNAQIIKQSQRRFDELAMLRQVTSLITAGTALDEVMRSVCEIALDMMSCQRSAIFLLSEDGQTVNLAKSIGLSMEFIKKAQQTDINHTRATVIRTSRALVLQDFHAEVKANGLEHLLEDADYNALVEVPLTIGENTIGSLVAFYDEPHRFLDTEIELIWSLAGQTAIAIENARLFEATNARRRDLESLYAAGQAINSSLSLTTVLSQVAENMIEVLGSEVCLILLANDENDLFTTDLCLRKTGNEITEVPLEPTTFTLDELPHLTQAIDQQDFSPVLLDENSDCLSLLKHCTTDTALCLPLGIHGALVGAVVMGYDEYKLPINAELTALAQALASQAAVAIQNARLFERTDVALARRVEEKQLLARVISRMSRRLDLTAVIEQVAIAAADATGAENCEVALLDEKEGQLNIVTQIGNLQHSEEYNTWRPDEGLSALAFKTCQPVNCGDVTQSEDYVRSHPDIMSEMVMPIVLDRDRLGLINLESTRINAFDNDQVRFIANLAEHAALAIRNARLFEKVQSRAEEFQTLRDIALDLMAAEDLKHTLHVIAQQAMNRTSAKDIHIYLYDQETDRLTFGTSLWKDGSVDVEFATPRPNGMTALVARTGEPILIRDASTHPLFSDVIDQPEWEFIQAMMSRPLKRGNEVVGVFNIAIDNDFGIADETEYFLDLLAAQAAIAITTARMVDQTRSGRDTLAAILNSIDDGIALFDMEGRLVLVNPRMEELSGTPLTPFMGQHFRKLLRKVKFYDPEETRPSLRGTVEMLREIMEDSHIVTRRSYVFPKPVLRYLDEISLPVVNEENEPIGRLYILRDTTKEREIQMFRQEMSHMLVHDLRSPLSGVITGLRLAMDEAALLPQEAEVLVSAMELSLVSAEGLLSLIEQLLDINRLEAGEMPLHLTAVNLVDMAEKVRHLMAADATEHGIELVISASDDLPLAKADEESIRRVFTNLLDNALRFTPQGGTITISIQEHPTTLEVTVTDTGDGIAPELRERIFERFFQGDTSQRKRGSRGSGLGLTFCRLAIEAHGERIWAADGPEGGAAFHFKLPKLTENGNDHGAVRP